MPYTLASEETRSRNIPKEDSTALVDVSEHILMCMTPPFLTKMLCETRGWRYTKEALEKL